MGVPRPEWLQAARGRLGILRRAVEGCDAVVALSRHAAHVFKQSIGHEPRVIAPGVNLATFASSAERSPRPTIVCSAAAEEPRKNIGLLIDAFALVRERYKDARLLLSRPGDRGGASRAPVDLYAPGVQWLDLDDRAALARAYSEAWVAVLPAVGEAFGLILVEALACGTPVVGYADAGIPEIIDRPEIGQLFDRLEPAGLARALIATCELADDPRTAERCRGRAEEFSIDRCVNSYLNLYGRLLGGASPQDRIDPVVHQTASV
jgi:phosphatidylinositol alpha-mannosyltransferase